MDEVEVPTMDWDALENCIAELQMREKEKEATRGIHNRGTTTYPMIEGESTRVRVQIDDSYDDNEMTRRIVALTSRRQSKMNLQLCFINDSSSDQESEAEDATPSQDADEPHQVSTESCQESGLPTRSKSFSEKRKELKMEAERLLAEAKKQMQQNERTAKETCTALLTKQFGDEIAGDEKKQRLEHSDLQKMSLKQIEILKESITSAVQNLNTELMQLLLTRDELKMEQDAFLLEMEDWAKLEESQQRHSWRKEEK